MSTAESKSALGAAMKRLEELIDWEQRSREPGQRGQAMRVDLGPIEDLASLAGWPNRALRVVHVAGSKGKGSVAALVAAGLRGAGLRVGRYGSPHVERINERIELDGEPIADHDLARALEAALDARDAAVMTGTVGSQATWFDVLTLAGMLAMRAAGIEHAVFECGLGGRLDSTNLLVGEVCVVTNVELEHTEVLGTTRAAIAFEKGSILGAGATLVTGVQPGPDEAGSVLDKLAGEQGAEVLRPSWTGDGAHSISIREQNRELANLVLDELGRRDWAGDQLVSSSCLGDELAEAAQLPGRLEQFEYEGCRVVLDGAHVPASLEAVFQDLDGRPGTSGSPVVVFGVAQDKDLEGLLKILAAHTDRLVCTSVGTRTAMPSGALVENAKRFVAGAERVPAPRMAFAHALELCSKDDWIFVTGSLHLIGAIRPLLGEESAAARNKRSPA